MNETFEEIISEAIEKNPSRNDVWTVALNCLLAYKAQLEKQILEIENGDIIELTILGLIAEIKEARSPHYTDRAYALQGKRAILSIVKESLGF